MGRPRTAEKRLIDGVIIPTSLDSHSAANFVLTQTAGKLKPADFRKAIQRHKAEQAAQAKELAKEMAKEDAASGKATLNA